MHKHIITEANCLSVIAVVVLPIIYVSVENEGSKIF